MPGPTHRGTWKARERQAAKLFGAHRQRCSGSSGLAHETRSDSTHPRIFIEGKLRGDSPIHREFAPILARAKAERVIPVLAFEVEGRAGFLVAFHSADLAELASRAGAVEEIAGALVSAQDETTPRRPRRKAPGRPVATLPGFGAPDRSPDGSEPFWGRLARPVGSDQNDFQPTPGLFSGSRFGADPKGIDPTLTLRARRNNRTQFS